MPPDGRRSAATIAARAADCVTYAGIGDEAGPGLEEQLEAMGRLGWRAIELRSVDGVPLAELDDAAFAPVARALSERGLAVPCIAAQIAGWSRSITGDPAADIAELEVLARRCHAIQCRYVRVMSYANDGLDDPAWGVRAIGRLRELTLRAEQHGLTLLHENCTGWAGTSGQRMLDLVDAVDHPAFGLLFDTGNGIDHGYDALELLHDISALVRHVHVKDAIGHAGAAHYTEPGAGHCEVAQCLRLLLDTGYAGAWSIEPHVALRPHHSGSYHVNGEPKGGLLEGFVACGAALERLVAEHVLPATTGWHPAPGAIVRELQT